MPADTIPRTPPGPDPGQPRQLRRIVRLFRPYSGKLAVVGLLVCAASLVSVVTPFLLKAALDTAIPQGRTGLLTLLALGMILSAVVVSAFGVLQTLISTTVGQRVMHDLRTAVYARLQGMSLAFFTRTRTGEVQSRIANDIGGMQATVTSTATSLVSNLTSVIATFVAMLALDWRLTVVSLLLLPVFVWISRRVGRERKRIATQRQKQMAVMAATVTESLSVSGILLGRTMGRTDSLTKSFARESEGLVDLEVRSNMAGRWRMSVITMVMSAMPAVLYWTAGMAAAAAVPRSPSAPSSPSSRSSRVCSGRPSVCCRRGRHPDLARPVPADLRVPRPARRHHRGGRPRAPGPGQGRGGLRGVEFRYDDPSGAVLDGIDIRVPAGGASPSSVRPERGSPHSVIWCLGCTT